MQIVGFLPLSVRAAGTQATARSYWELQGLARELASALLTVMDDLRERAGLPRYRDAEEIAAAIDRRLESFADFMRRDAEELAERTGREVTTHDPEWWRGWRQEERPLEAWLGYAGVSLGAALFEAILAGDEAAEGDRRDHAPDGHLLRPLEQVLDVIDWLAERVDEPAA